MTTINKVIGQRPREVLWRQHRHGIPKPIIRPKLEKLAEIVLVAIHGRDIRHLLRVCKEVAERIAREGLVVAAQGIVDGFKDELEVLGKVVLKVVCGRSEGVEALEGLRVGEVGGVVVGA